MDSGTATDKHDRHDVGERSAAHKQGEFLNVGALAAQYSQIAGLLAGFGFAGFTIYLTTDDRPANAGTVAASLFSAFAALVLTAILYALLVGEPSQKRQAIAGCIYGLPFGLAVLTMFQTLTLMSAGVEDLSEAVDLGRFLVIAIGPPIVMARLTIAAGYLRTGRASGRGAHPGDWAFSVLLLIGGGYVAIVRPDIPLSLPRVLTVAGIGLISAVVVGLMSPWVSTRPFDYVPGRWFVIAFLTMAFLAIALFILAADAALGAASV